MKNYKKPKLNYKFIIISFITLIVMIASCMLINSYNSNQETASSAVVEGKLYTVNSKIPGMVMYVYVTDSQEVKKGDLIVELDRVYYENILRNAENELRECKLQLNSENSNTGQNKKDSFSKFKFNNSGVFDNYHKMFDDDNPQEQPKNDDTTCLTSKESKHKLNSDLKPIAETTAQTNDKKTVELEEDLQTKIKRLETEIEQAKLNLSYTKIYAPQDGTVSSVEIREGEYISSAQNLVSVIPKRVWVSAVFTEQQSEKLEPGQAVIIKCSKYPTRKFKGMIDEIEQNKKINIKGVVYVPVRILFTEDYSDFDITPSTPVKATVKLKKYLW